MVFFVVIEFKVVFFHVWLCTAGTGMSSGVNFAIPIDTVVRTVPYLIVYGTPYSERF